MILYSIRQSELPVYMLYPCCMLKQREIAYHNTRSYLLHIVQIRGKNVLCVTGCCHHDIAMNLQHQNGHKFTLCVSRHLTSMT